MSKILIFICFVLLFGSCAGKSTRVEYAYKDKFIPVACTAKMPNKPLGGDSFKDHKAKMVYYRECESTLKQCLGIKE